MKFHFCLMLAFAIAAKAAPTAAIFTGNDGNLGHEIAVDIHEAGYVTRMIGVGVLTNTDALLGLHPDLLVLPEARVLPVKSMEPVVNYLRHGGNLIAMGLPAWGDATFQVDGRWFSSQDFHSLLDSVKADHEIVGFSAENISHWIRSADGPTTTMKTDIEDGDCLHVTIDNLAGWATLLNNTVADPFPDRRNLTCLWARGSLDTRAMLIEWQEQDGSRWIATIDLTNEWKSYALPPEAFHFWPSVAGRGGVGDKLNVHHAVKLSIGIARSHSVLPGPHHEYWVSAISSARSPWGEASPPTAVEAPALDTISPSWKFYPIHGVVTLDSSIAATPRDPVLLAMQPRPSGVGFNQQRPWRWIPLLDTPAGNDYRGAIGTMMVHVDDEFKHGIWACFASEDTSFYNQPKMREVISNTASSIRRGLFLAEGGAEFFTVFENQKFKVGARVVNFGEQTQSNVNVRVTIRPKKSEQIAFLREWPVNLAPDETQTMEEAWQIPKNAGADYIVTTELLQVSNVIDHLEHELGCWRPNPHPKFIEERDGGFVLEGKPWKINGVNYMPATGIGVSSGSYFENWLGKGAYDPEAIQRDLDRIKGMGLNAVSIFIDHSNMRAQHLLDFLRRCEEMGLRVNLSLRPGTPLDFQWDKIRDLIEFYHLAENDTVFAYDLAWEPEHSDQPQNYGRDWTDWVVHRYGNLEHARSIWGEFAPRAKSDGILSVPPGTQLATDGAWRIVANDYRAFLDSELARKYGEARRLVRSIDPHHAVSFRMSEAGDPTFISSDHLPFDFYGLADAVDFWAPEAYGRIGDWDRVREGRFDIDYARLCDPKKPVIWAEMGYSVWDENRNDDSSEKLEFQGEFCRNFYRMMTDSGCDGIFFWWYPGGYRFNERSDFGIINPDGTDRPITRVIREEGPKFLSAGKPAPDYFINVDRDRDARGLYGIYQAVKQEYWQAIENGKRPALRWAKKPGR